MRYFNTAGPCVPEWHYMLPPEPRLPEGRPLVENGQYFVVHAARQAGKTTTLGALARQLTAEGRHAALMFSCESAEVARDDYGTAERQVLSAIRSAARLALPAALRPPGPWPEADPGHRVFEALQEWALACPVPLVLFFDEVDALRGESLRSVLRQLRDGFQYRAHAFPASVALSGLRDVRDYQAQAGASPARPGTASLFSVSVKALRIGDFSRDEAAALYAQHTGETGQEFTPDAIDRAYSYSQGQPWLVNALARAVTAQAGVQPPAPVTAADVEAARDRLVLARATHLESLAGALREPRVRRVIDPLIAGTLPDVGDAYDDDIGYARDLGLIAPGNPVRIANPVYREVIAGVLGAGIETVITEDPGRFALADGRLDFPRLLGAFADFWVEHGEVLASAQSYQEAAAHLVCMAFLHRIVNGGGHVDREYGVGRGRIDLLLRRPYGDHQEQAEALELTAWRPGQPDPLATGLRQLDRYLDRFRLDTGTLIVFDRRPDAAPIAERTHFSVERSPSGRAITVLRA